MSKKTDPPLKLNFSPQPSIFTGLPQHNQPPKNKEPEFDELSTCYYVEQVYVCCHVPYTTKVPPQIRHLPTCSHAHQVLPVNIQPKLICSGLRRSPVAVEIFATCDPCIENQVNHYPRADYHGLKQLGLPGEWALVYKHENSGECGDGSVMKERWVRVQGEKGWRDTEREMENSLEQGGDITVRIDGEEWNVLC